MSSSVFTCDNVFFLGIRWSEDLGFSQNIKWLPNSSCSHSVFSPILFSRVVYLFISNFTCFCLLNLDSTAPLAEPLPWVGNVWWWGCGLLFPCQWIPVVFQGGNFLFPLYPCVSCTYKANSWSLFLGEFHGLSWFYVHLMKTGEGHCSVLSWCSRGLKRHTDVSR